MYTSFFGFTESPFNLTPDPRYLFLSHHHKEAIDHLLYGINERKGFIVITGGIGTGKTTLCRVLLNHLEASTKSALIFNSFISDMELLESINQEFNIEMAPEARTKKDYIGRSDRLCLYRTVLVICLWPRQTVGQQAQSRAEGDREPNQRYRRHGGQRKTS